MQAVILCIIPLYLSSATFYTALFFVGSTAVATLVTCLTFIETVCEADIQHPAIPLVVNSNVKILIPAVSAPLLDAEKITALFDNTNKALTRLIQ